MRITTRFRAHRAVVVAGCALAAYALSACTAPDSATGDTANAVAGSATTAALSTDPAQARGAIDSTNAANASAFARGDSAAVAQLTGSYQSDAVLMLPNQAPLRGADAIGGMFKGMFSEISISNVRMQSDDLMVSGDLAVETGRYSWTVTPKGAPAMPDSGKFVTVWRKQSDGAWKIARDINNSDVPLAR
ncbi:MAG: DUF4440 domain-containing protein [Gemmatimonadota bacterium]